MALPLCRLSTYSPCYFPILALDFQRWQSRRSSSVSFTIFSMAPRYRNIKKIKTWIRVICNACSCELSIMLFTVACKTTWVKLKKNEFIEPLELLLRIRAAAFARKKKKNIVNRKAQLGFALTFHTTASWNSLRSAPAFSFYCDSNNVDTPGGFSSPS